MSESLRDLRGRITDALRGRDDVWLALLFGSRARATETPESDLDLAVWAPDVDLLQLGAELTKRLGIEVDIVSLDPPAIPLLEEIVADGIVVHEGRSGAHGSWRARALSILELDGPWYRRMRDAYLRRVAAHGLVPATPREP